MKVEKKQETTVVLTFDVTEARLLELVMESVYSDFEGTGEEFVNDLSSELSDVLVGEETIYDRVNVEGDITLVPAEKA